MPLIRYRPGYDPKTREHIGPKPRPSRAKPKKTRTCPICAETFKASRSDQTFCGATCRNRSHRESTPANVEASAEALRAQRRVAREQTAEKRAAAKSTRLAYRQRKAEEFARWEAEQIARRDRLLAETTEADKRAELMADFERFIDGRRKRDLPWLH